MTEYRITRTTYTKERIYIEADSEEIAEEMARGKNAEEWEDWTDERFMEEYEVEEA